MTTTHIRPESPAETRERCKKFGAEWYGDKIEFRASGRSIPRAMARGIFVNHGYGDHLPAVSKPESILVRAAGEGDKRGMLCRKFVSPNRDTSMAIHVTRVTGSGETGDAYTCLARVRIAHRTDPSTGDRVAFAVAKPPEGQTEFLDREARGRAIWIANHANTLMHEAQNKDFGKWLRSVFVGIGAAQSLGGGNNFYVSAPLCDNLHSFMCAIQSQLGVYYVRDPKTSMGASHERATMAQAAHSSLREDIATLKGKLKHAVESSGGARKRTAADRRQLAKLDELRGKIELYRAIVKKNGLDELDECAELYRQHFNTLLDGGKVNWTDDDNDGSDNGTPPAPVDSGAYAIASASTVGHVAWG